MTARRSAVVVTLAAVLVTLGACAWTNRANRPVWNAFEDNLVPDDNPAFALTLPLTIPAGIAAIATDTFVVHPATVVDDAFDDTCDLWRDIAWEEHYYTSLAALPFRVVATPCAFVFSFLRRSAFDVAPDRSADEIVAEAASREQQRVTALLAWFDSIAHGRDDHAGVSRPREWTTALQVGFDDALAHGNALGRAALLRSARYLHLPPYTADPYIGLRDSDPLVRYQELGALERADDVPTELRAALLTDPVESVRLRAQELWK